MQNSCREAYEIYTQYNAINKTNSESFYYLFNVYYNLMCEVNLIDENFNDQTEESFKELIRDKQEKGIPTVVQFIYYVNQ